MVLSDCPCFYFFLSFCLHSPKCPEPLLILLCNLLGLPLFPPCASAAHQLFRALKRKDKPIEYEDALEVAQVHEMSVPLLFGFGLFGLVCLVWFGWFGWLCCSSAYISRRPLASLYAGSQTLHGRL